MKAVDNPGWRDNEVMDFRILGGGSKVKSRASNMDFRRANFNLFRYLFGKIPKDTILLRRGIKFTDPP